MPKTTNAQEARATSEPTTIEVPIEVWFYLPSLSSAEKLEAVFRDLGFTTRLDPPSDTGAEWHLTATKPVTVEALDDLPDHIHAIHGMMGDVARLAGGRLGGVESGWLKTTPEQRETLLAAAEALAC